MLDVMLLMGDGTSDYELVHLFEGDGSNLWKEDMDEGYVDYLMWDTYGFNCGIVDLDSGMLMTKKYVAEMTVDEAIDLMMEDVGYRGQWLNLMTNERGWRD